jgi:hypothetical protein
VAKETLNKDFDLVKTLKLLGTGVREEMEAMGEDDLRSAIVDAEVIIRDTDGQMKSDPKINGAAEILKDLRKGYTDTKAAQKAKTKYALHLLDQKGHI